jgi:hypothetical protein
MTPLKASLVASVCVSAIVGCGSGGDDVTGPGNTGNPPPVGALPSDLVAAWHLEQAGDPVCDPSTGQCTSSYARSETLELTGGGTFQHSLFAESNLPPCSLTAHHQSSGTAEADGTTLQLHIATGLTRVEDTCGESGDTDEAGRTYTYTYEITPEAGGPAQLMLIDDKGTRIGPFVPQ